MQQNKRIKNLFYLAIFTTVVVVTWIASSVYYRIITPTTPQDTNQYTTPIVPTFDLETLGQLSQRIQVPINLTEQGDYLSDPLQPNSGTQSASLQPDSEEITVTITPEPDQDETPDPTQPPADEENTPPPDETL